MQEIEIFNVNGVKFGMVKVEGGTFKMGASEKHENDDMEYPIHDVTLSTYYIGQTEVTQELWESVMGKNPSAFKGNNQRPVECVSWNDCQEFIIKLNKLTGKTFRLPTEAEWEFAARGGVKSKGYKYSGSNNADEVAWYKNNSDTKNINPVSTTLSNGDLFHYGPRTQPVASKLPNELGLYDMSGNVWEWCSDYEGEYSDSHQTNPKGPDNGDMRIMRGGSFLNPMYCMYVSYRHCEIPDNDGGDRHGLRLAL